MSVNEDENWKVVYLFLFSEVWSSGAWVWFIPLSGGAFVACRILVEWENMAMEERFRKRRKSKGD